MVCGLVKALSFGEGTEFVVDLYRMMVVRDSSLITKSSSRIQAGHCNLDLAMTVTTGVEQILIQPGLRL